MRLALLALLPGCSLTTYDYEACTTNGDCRDAFGFGSVCGEDGLCGPMQAEPRCSTGWPADVLVRPEEYRDAIVIGSLFDRSADVPETQAVRLGVKQVNDGAGLNGTPYVLVECSYEEDLALDNLTMAEATAHTAEWLADVAGASAIIGPATSSQTQVAFTTVNLEHDYGAVIISPSATSPALTSLDGLSPSDADPGLLWRTAPPDSLQGTVQAIDMRNRGSRKVAAVYEDGPYGNGLVDAFIAEFEDDTHDADRLPFSDDSQRNSAVQQAGDATYDEVLFISGEIDDVIAFLDAAAVVSGYDGRPIFLADGARDTAMLEGISPSARPLLALIRGTAPSTPSGDVYEAFASAYAAEFSPDQASASVYTSYSYDATWLAIYGTAWSTFQEGEVTGVGIARGLRHVSSGASVVIRSDSWSDVRAHFAEGDGVDVDGASGDLDYDPATEETTAPIDVWIVNADSTGFVTEATYNP